jgi:hypothetical protein
MATGCHVSYDTAAQMEDGMRAMHTLLATSLAAISLVSASVGAAQNSAPKKVDIVSVTGCLREQGAGNWMMVAATDPVPSNANAPLKRDLPTTPVTGSNQFKLIGVGEFNLPTFRNQTVVVKGLYIKATPVDRLNITSVTTAVTSCAETAPK